MEIPESLKIFSVRDLLKKQQILAPVLVKKRAVMRKKPSLGKFGPKIQNCLHKVNFGT